MIVSFKRNFTSHLYSAGDLLRIAIEGVAHQTVCYPKLSLAQTVINLLNKPYSGQCQIFWVPWLYLVGFDNLKPSIQYKSYNGAFHAEITTKSPGFTAIVFTSKQLQIDWSFDKGFSTSALLLNRKRVKTLWMNPSCWLFILMRDRYCSLSESRNKLQDSIKMVTFPSPCNIKYVQRRIAFHVIWWRKLIA